jgi:hypothetical protein
MQPSLRIFLTGLIDYAGMFPPAQLPLAQAIAQFARYRLEPEGWMLGRFVCQAARLNELAPLAAELFVSGPPLTVSALGRGGTGAEDYLAKLRDDLSDVEAFNRQMGAKAKVDAYEVRLPLAPLATLLADTTALIESGNASLAPFCEAPTADAAVMLALIEALPKARHAGPPQQWLRPGFKLRTGGLEAAAFPSNECVAKVLAASARAHVPFKATAGLHHPLRGFRPEIGSAMHGFVNVFAAGCFAVANPEAPLQAILEDDDPSNFQWLPDGLRWRDLFISNDELARARRIEMLSFGSCSFDEPRQDLQRLHWLP